MRAICWYMHIHQPVRYREYSIFDVGNTPNYFNDIYSGRQCNERIFHKVAEKSYRPMLYLLKRKMEQHPDFKVSFSITGTWMEQAQMWAPDLIELIRWMVQRGQCEIVGETYYHSLAFFYNRDEFTAQVAEHAVAVEKLFGVRPRVFRNTEFAYNDELAKWAEKNGYKGILAEGWDKVLGWRSPNYVYQPAGCTNLRLLLKNYRLSDDIAFRFSDHKWSEWPLTVPKYLKWLDTAVLNGPLINLFMDFETFGEHQWKDTGIFDFVSQWVDKWLSDSENSFVSVSEACELMEPVGEIAMPETVTWADTERDLSAWLSNEMQKSAEEYLYEMRDEVLGCGNADLIHAWRLLTTSDHPYSMCTKYWNDGDVHAYFSAYASPYESFMFFMNVLRDLDFRVKKCYNGSNGYFGG